MWKPSAFLSALSRFISLMPTVVIIMEFTYNTQEINRYSAGNN